MTGDSVRPRVAPIEEDDIAASAAFLTEHLNPDVPAESWIALLRPPWPTLSTRGFRLLVGDELVGVYAMVYSIRGERVVCNLAAFCVMEQHRAHSLRLLRAALAQPGMVFTDLSPSGNVPALNVRLGFSHLDTATRLVANLPLPLPLHLPRGAALTTDPERIASMLSGEDATVFRDHRRAPAARHVLVCDGDRYAYLMYRRDARKRLRIFASPLYVGGDRALLQRSWPRVSAHLRRQGMLATLAERRVLGFVPGGWGAALRHPRPKMFKGASADEVDYLYSELTLLEW